MPFIIPVFIPHQGCPQQCLFCNQISISGQQMHWEDEHAFATRTIDKWLARPHLAGEVQVAFYGGSFTCLPVQRQEELLGAVQPFLQRGAVQSIRLSTRPDCVNESVCDFLLERGVRTVELGVQSLDDRVLLASRRGHSAEQSVQAVKVLQEKGMSLGVQLMPGLPKEDTRSFVKTVRQVVALGPAFVRLYPTLIVRGAALAVQYEKKEYREMSMNRAIALCSTAKEYFDRAGIKIIRMGLQASSSLEKELLAGPYHPAFGELVAARVWFRKVRSLLFSCPVGQRVHISISHRDVSTFVGQKRVNMKRLQDLGLLQRLQLTIDENMERGTMHYVVN